MNNLFLLLVAVEPVAETAPEKWQMNPVLYVVLALGLIVFYVMLFFMLKRRQLILKYTLFWMLSGLVLLIFMLFPVFILQATALIGIANPVNAIFLLFAGVALMLILSLTSIVSQLSDKNRALVQSLSLIEKRVRTLEENELSK